MSSGDNLCCVVQALRCNRRRFDYNCHNRAPLASGLYAFWVDKACLYVGKSINLRTRLYQHRMQEHNSTLKRYLKAFAQQVEVSLATPAECKGVDPMALEGQLIRILRPISNVLDVI